MRNNLINIESTPYYGFLTQEELKLNEIPEEIWVKVTDKIIPGILPIYLVSNYGNVYSENTGRYMYQGTGKDSEYLLVWLSTYYGKSVPILVSRLVKLCFDYREDHNNLEVHHKDTNPKHNWLWNLEWLTPRDHFEATEYDDINGENNPQAKITNEQAMIICKLLEKGHSIPEILEIIKDEINIDRNHLYHIVYSIKTRSRWKKISEPYSF